MPNPASFVANNGEPCRFCHKPFSVSAYEIGVLRALGLYPDSTSNQEIAADLDICSVHKAPSIQTAAQSGVFAR